MVEERQPDGAEVRPPGDGAPSHDQQATQRAVRIERRGQSLPDVEPAEVVQGAKPGSRYARLVRTHDRRFERGAEEGTFRATRRATAPRTAAQLFWERVRRIAVGSPLASE